MVGQMIFKDKKTLLEKGTNHQNYIMKLIAQEELRDITHYKTTEEVQITENNENEKAQ